MCLVVIGTTPSFGFDGVVNGVADPQGYYIGCCIKLGGLYFVALQTIASTLMAMSKTDVRNYTKKLLSCSYISRAADDMVEDE